MADRVKSCRAPAALGGSDVLTPAPGAGVAAGDSPGRGAASAPRDGVRRGMGSGAAGGDPRLGEGAVGVSSLVGRASQKVSRGG